MNRLPAPSDYLPDRDRKIAAHMRRPPFEDRDLDESTIWAGPGTNRRSKHAKQGWFDEDADPDTDVDDLGLIDVSTWDGIPVPQRKWVLPDWIPLHAVTLIAGKGGTGKSLVAQQLLSAIATGADFMNIRPSGQFGALYVNCEDGTDELHRRQDAIARTMGRTLSGFGGRLNILARIGKENALGTVGKDGEFVPSALYVAIRYAAKRLGARVIALDNAMQLFVGNPNDNGEVTRFLNALTALALDIDGAVILVAHIAKADGSEFMGCMAWENGVRSRLYLTHEDEKNGLGDVRILSRNKANMAAVGAQIAMEWRSGAFYPFDQNEENSREQADEAVFLACLDAATEAKRNVSHVPGSNYACKVFERMPQAGKRNARTLAAAMDRLIYRGEINVDQALWQDVHRKWKTGLKRTDKCGDPPVATPCGDLRQPIG
jgi:RecA-family ATPase